MKRELAAEWEIIPNLRPMSPNPRKNDQAVERVAKSIQRFGFGAPLLVWRDGIIIAGHTRWKAAKMLGIETVPVRRMAHLSEMEARLLNLADNRLAELSEWDPDLLPEAIEGFGPDELQVAGFDSTSLASILKEEGDGLGGDGAPAMTKPIQLTEDQRVVFERAVESIRRTDGDDLSEGRIVELLSADYLAGAS